MEPSRAEVLDWLEARLGLRLDARGQADVLGATGCSGDAAAALIDAFAARFGVDMAGYRAEMHHLPEPHLMQLRWPLPDRPRHGVAFPLSVTTLHQAARHRRWPVTYPSLAEVPNFEWANLLLVGLGLPLLTAALIWAVPRLF